MYINECACVSYLDRGDMCMWCVAMYGLHGGKVLVTHMKHLGTFPWSQMCWTVLQGGRLLILVPVLLQVDTNKVEVVSSNRTHSQGSSYWLNVF